MALVRGGGMLPENSAEEGLRADRVVHCDHCFHWTTRQNPVVKVHTVAWSRQCAVPSGTCSAKVLFTQWCLMLLSNQHRALLYLGSGPLMLIPIQ